MIDHEEETLVMHGPHELSSQLSTPFQSGGLGEIQNGEVGIIDYVNL
jgi:hypothetical protein